MAEDPQAQEGEVQEEATDMAQAPQEEAGAVAGASETVTEENGDGGAEEEAAPVEVAASEPDPWHRAAHFANHPDLAVFPADVSDSSVVSGMPFHHLRFAGFPCVSYSRLNRTVTYARLREGLHLFDSLMVSVQAQPAPVVLLENVASLLFADLDWVLEHIESSLRGLCAARVLQGFERSSAA